MASHSHRHYPHPTRKWLWAALAIVLVGGAAAVALALKKSPRSAAAECPHPVRLLRVVAAPDIAPAVAAVAKSVVFADCNPTRIVVTGVDPATQAAALRADTRNRPDVWIPDSSMWLTKVTATTVAAPSIARTPAVLAVAAPAAHSLGTPSFHRLAATATTAKPFVLAVADPTRSAATLGVLVGLHTTLASTAEGAGDLAAMLQNTTPLAGATLPATPAALNGSPVAVPTTEQAVWAANRKTFAYTALYPPTPAPTLDYPFVVPARGAERDAHTLLTALTSARGSAVLAAHGFRSPSGAAAAGLRSMRGIDTSVSTAASGLGKAEVGAVLQAMSALRKPSRLLALIDVSGSMASPVPGLHGNTRIEVARTAAAEGLGLLPPDSAIGLWRFSANLTSSTDYQQLVPVAPLSDTTRGQLAAAVSQLQPVRNGGTGLYDSVLGAVQSMRAHFDPTRVNSVVVLTDGKDEADPKHGITLSALVSALKAQSASAQPVKVVAVAYGPDTDTAALRAITAASGGILYTSVDPRNLPRIFRNAIGHRICTSHC
jgi:Ca-activated chloride channel family protein